VAKLPLIAQRQFTGLPLTAPLPLRRPPATAPPMLRLHLYALVLGHLYNNTGIRLYIHRYSPEAAA